MRRRPLARKPRSLLVVRRQLRCARLRPAVPIDPRWTWRVQISQKVGPASAGILATADALRSPSGDVTATIASVTDS